MTTALSREVRLVGLLTCLSSLSACSGCVGLPSDDGGSPSDAGSDSGIGTHDAGTDGGSIHPAGGCFNGSTGKFILYFETESLCSAVSFRHFDGGMFMPLFESTTAAMDDYLIDDARVGPCWMSYEESSGRLNQGMAPLEYFSGKVGWNYIVQTMPITYDADGVLNAFGLRYVFATPEEGAGITNPCLGP